MEARQLADITKVCWDHNIYVVVKPTSYPGKYKLAISRNGKETVGDEVYQDKPYEKTVVASDGAETSKKVKRLIPAVHEKIHQIYIDIYNKNFNHKN